MKTLFDMIFGVVKFTFKVTFWIIGVVIALLIGPLLSFFLAVILLRLCWTHELYAHYIAYAFC